MQWGADHPTQPEPLASPNPGILNICTKMGTITSNMKMEIRKHHG